MGLTQWSNLLGQFRSTDTDSRYCQQPFLSKLDAVWPDFLSLAWMERLWGGRCAVVEIGTAQPGPENSAVTRVPLCGDGAARAAGCSGPANLPSSPAIEGSGQRAQLPPRPPISPIARPPPSRLPLPFHSRPAAVPQPCRSRPPPLSARPFHYLTRRRRLHGRRRRRRYSEVISDGPWRRRFAAALTSGGLIKRPVGRAAPPAAAHFLSIRGRWRAR